MGDLLCNDAVKYFTKHYNALSNVLAVVGSSRLAYLDVGHPRDDILWQP